MKKDREKKKKRRVEANLIDLQPGLAFSSGDKLFLDSMADLEGITLRVVDPGVHRAWTSVDILTGESDVRKSKMALRTSAWRSRTKAKVFGETQRRWHAEVLGDVQKMLNTTPHRNSSFLERYRSYVDNVYAHWQEQWNFFELRKRDGSYGFGPRSSHNESWIEK